MEPHVQGWPPPSLKIQSESVVTWLENNTQRGFHDGPGNDFAQGSWAWTQWRWGQTNSVTRKRWLHQKKFSTSLVIVYRIVLVLPEKMDTCTFSLKRQKPTAGRAKILQSMLEGKSASKEIKGSVWKYFVKRTSEAIVEIQWLKARSRCQDLRYLKL